MARSRKSAEQELQRLQMMLRAMKDQKDDAAQKIRDRIAAVELELGGNSSGSGKSGPNILVIAALVLLVGILAFLAMYFGIRISQT
ncbi:MAG: hypothetical protein P1V34_19140 [Alphaproteobacteria bacterium]|nr:hypothetical protein [Alphaproteobacteria bacterium]